MTRQYLRSARAVIGLGDEQIEITDLKMVFEVTKSLRGGLANSCILDIYNLAPATRTRIQEQGTALQLFAGYDGSPEQIYLGQLRRVVHERERADWVSKVYCADGYVQTQESTISKSFIAGTPAATLIRSVVESFGGTESPRLQDIDSLPALLGSRVLSGAAKTVMDQLADDYGLDWGWQDGRIEVSGKSAHFADEAVVISPESGMIGHPIVTDQGIEVTTLLNPRIRIKRNVRIKSRAAALRVANIEMRAAAPSLYDGEYTVSRVVFGGDTRGPDWYSRIITYPAGTVAP